MSISAVGSSSVFGTTLGQGQQTNSVFNTGASSDEIAASIVDKDDADGDGLLSLEETPLDEERFSAIDTDGDGFISAEELSADAQARQAERDSFMNQLGVQMQGSEAQTANASGNASGSGESEEEYDEYDLNQDGTVSLDELMQAYKGGDTSLETLFTGMGESFMSSLTQRYAMEAYQAQMA